MRTQRNLRTLNPQVSPRLLHHPWQTPLPDLKKVPFPGMETR